MIETQAMNERFGADVSGVALDTISDAEFESVYRAWLDYGVLRFRDQELDEDGLQRFSRRFGPLEEIPIGKLTDEQREKLSRIIRNPYVTNISNIVEDGMPMGALGNAEARWHSDMTYMENPPPASVLLSVEIPPEGGDTWFADQRAAYEALPATLRQRVEDLSIKHDASHTSVGDMRPGYEPVDDPRDAPGVLHPLVRVHEETQCKCLYLGRREWAYIPGMSLEESEALLDEVWSYATLPENVIRQQWQVGDVIIWDNRRVLHRRDEFDPSQRRLLRRCQVLSPAQAGEQ